MRACDLQRVKTTCDVYHSLRQGSLKRRISAAHSTPAMMRPRIRIRKDGFNAKPKQQLGYMRGACIIEDAVIVWPSEKRAGMAILKNALLEGLKISYDTNSVWQRQDLP